MRFEEQKTTSEEQGCLTLNNGYHVTESPAGVRQCVLLSLPRNATCFQDTDQKIQETPREYIPPKIGEDCRHERI